MVRSNQTRPTPERKEPEMSEQEFAGCQVCGRKDVGMKKDGTVRTHGWVQPSGNSCDGSGKLPKCVQYGVRFKPDGPVFAEASREKAEALRDEKGRGVLVAHEFVQGQPSDDEWREVAN
jgi:hypothetical protein